MKSYIVDILRRRGLMARAVNPVSTSALLAAGMFMAAGCAMSDEHTIAAPLEKDFRLRVGQSALINPGKLQVGFLEVTEDSRCGKGEVCFREGDAIVRVWLQLADEARQAHELHTGSRQSNTADYAGYRVFLVSLNPAPVSGRRIAPEEYVATLRAVDGVREDP